MPDYRFYQIGVDGRIFQAVEAVCLDDAEALRHARGQRAPCEIEIWEGKRLVTRAPSHRAGEPAP